MTELDFQRADSDFLATKPEDLEEEMDKHRPSAWDSGKPYDWSAKKKKKKPEKESLVEGEGAVTGSGDETNEAEK